MCSTNLGNQLYQLWVVEPSIACDDNSTAIRTLGYGEEKAGDEGLAVMGLLKHARLLS